MGKKILTAFHRLPIFQQIYWPVFLMILLFSLVGNTALYNRQRRDLNERLVGEIKKSLDLLAYSLGKQFSTRNFQFTEELFTTFTKPHSEIIGGRIKNPAGLDLVSHSIGHDLTFSHWGFRQVNPYLGYLAIPIPNPITPPDSPNSEKNLGSIEILISTLGIYRDLQAKFPQLFFYEFLRLVAVALALTLILLVVLKPLQSLTDTMRRITAAREPQLIQVPWGNEWGLIARSFNEMLQSLDRANIELREKRVAEALLEQERQKASELAEANRALQQMNEKLLNAQKAMVESSKLAALGELTSGVAHEINNPLTGIMMAVEFLEGELPPEDPHHKDLKEIALSADRIATIVRDLLQFSRAERDQFQQVDPVDLVNSVVNLTSRKFLKQGVTLEFRHLTPVPRVHLQPARIQQVLINLLENSFDAILDRLKLTGSARMIINLELGLLEKDSGRFFISVEDGGIGIREGDLGQIFVPFFTRKQHTRGTGLGLSICHGIIQNHQGEILFNSTWGEGTRVKILLPIEKIPTPN